MDTVTQGICCAILTSASKCSVAGMSSVPHCAVCSGCRSDCRRTLARGRGHHRRASSTGARSRSAIQPLRLLTQGQTLRPACGAACSWSKRNGSSAKLALLVGEMLFGDQEWLAPCSCLLRTGEHICLSRVSSAAE